jgi:hypothetical protein
MERLTNRGKLKYEQPIVALQRMGWLVPTPPAPAASSDAASTRLTRMQLEKRVADLEAEVARLHEQ